MIKIAQFIKYSIIGLFSTLFDFLLLWLLLNNTELHYLVAAAIAFCIATLIHYTFNRKFNYNQKRRKYATGAGYFMIINCLGLALTLGITAFLVELVSLVPLISRIIAAPIVGLLSYILNTKITFKETLRHD